MWRMGRIALALAICAVAILSAGQTQTGSLPEILAIRATGEEYKGRILFKDADGDAIRADLKIMEAADPQSITINGQTPKDNLVSLGIISPPEKQKEGQGIVLLKIATTTPQQVKIQVILVDKVGNESRPGEFSFRARGNLPDLVVSVEVSPSEVYVGQEVEVSHTIQNIGGGSAGPFRIGVYIDVDAALRSRNRLLLASQEISGLAPDTAVSQTIRVQLRQELLTGAALQPGRLFLGVIADDLNQVEESDEANNVASSAIQVQLPPKRPAFFKVVDLSVEPMSPVAGSTITIKATIENTGGQRAEKRITFYVDGYERDYTYRTLGPGASTEVTFSYRFDYAGTYAIKIASPDDYSTTSVTVAAPPRADFTCSPTSGTPPLTVSFYDRSSGNIASWYWEFGDGNTSTSRNPVHTYTRSGRYTVRLTVRGPGGSDTKEFCCIDVLQTGQVQVTLEWWSTADLDLHVVDPYGCTIYWENPYCARSRGELDVDANSDCLSVTTRPVENIFWPLGYTPAGDYKVYVEYWERCTGASAIESFKVTVVVDGVRREYRGTVRVDEKVHVVTFRR